MEDLLQAFGIAVRHLRTATSISQETLAERAGLDRTYVSALERGRKNPTLKTMAKRATALGVRPHVLLALAYEVIDAGDEGDQS